MACQVLPYAVEDYNSLPELNVAKHQFDSARGSDILFTEIGETFLKHHVEKFLGISLLHNHFFLKQHEMLVTVNSVAVPWDNTSGAMELADVNATAWRFTDRGLAPYEFAYAAAVEESLSRHPIQSFLLELAAVLEKWHLTNILGICSLPENSLNKPPTMEFTSGRANITLPFDIAPNDGNVIDAMWQFSADPMDGSPYAGVSCQGQQNWRVFTTLSMLTDWYQVQKAVSDLPFLASVRMPARENHMGRGISTRDCTWGSIVVES